MLLFNFLSILVYSCSLLLFTKQSSGPGSTKTQANPCWTKNMSSFHHLRSLSKMTRYVLGFLPLNSGLCLIPSFHSCSMSRPGCSSLSRAFQMSAHKNPSQRGAWSFQMAKRDQRGGSCIRHEMAAAVQVQFPSSHENDAVQNRASHRCAT